MTLIEDPNIASKYDEVRNDKNEENWMFLGFINDKADVLEVKYSGTDGLAGFVSKLTPELAGFGYIRVPLKNDEYSERTKFVFVTYCGSAVKIMRKAKLGVQKSQVQKVITSFSIDLLINDPKDLDEKEVLVRLKRAGGANYDRQTSDY